MSSTSLARRSGHYCGRRTCDPVSYHFAAGLAIYATDQFHTLIADVASTGNSGSGVFDPNRKCLLGIMSAKFTTIDGKDIAKYFVPAREIRDFIPIEFKEKVPMK